MTRLAKMGCWAALGFCALGCSSSDSGGVFQSGTSQGTTGGTGSTGAGMSATTAGNASNGSMGVSTSGAVGNSNGTVTSGSSFGVTGGMGGAGTTAGSSGSVGTGGVTSTSGSGTTGTTGTTGSSGWLHTSEDDILTENDELFHGRGANLHDTRSCDACSGLPPDPEGLMAWADELIDNWHANLIRFNLWSFADDGGFRVQWRSIVDDAEYYQDVQTVVNHMTSKPGVYVMVTLFLDPSMVPDGQKHGTWPTEDTLPVYEMLAEAFVNNPQVLFGLMNEPHDDESENAALANIFQKAIQTIRGVEDAHGTPQHIIVAQASQRWARDLSYWIEHPLGENIAYEVHVYNPASDFDDLVVKPSAQLPMLIGEFGYHQYMTIADTKTLMQVAEENDVPWIAWNFHQRCDPNLLADEGGNGYDGCGFEGAGTVYTWPTTEWGDAVKERLAMPW